MPAQIVMGSLAYLVHDGRVLLLKRDNPPFAGYWSAPGGKLEFGETPQECCIREVYEETGIRLISTPPNLRAIQTVIDVAIPIHWQLFIFRADLKRVPTLNPHPDHLEGELRWVKLDVVPTLRRPYTDSQHWTHILDTSLPIWQGKFVYDTPDKLTDEIVY